MHVLFATRPVADLGLGTFAVDQWWRLYIDPALLVGETSWGAHTVGAVLGHEVGHLLRDHAARARALAQPYDHRARNLAGDAEINDDLLAAGVPLPEGVVTPAALGCEVGGLAEDYYYATTRTDDSGTPDDGDGDGGCGSGSGDHPVPGELPGDTALTDGTSAGISSAEADLVRRRVAREVTDHAQSKGRGSVPGGLERWAEAIADRTGRCNYTYSRPSRRHVPGIVKPAMRGRHHRRRRVASGSAPGWPRRPAAGAGTGGVRRIQGLCRLRGRRV